MNRRAIPIGPQERAVSIETECGPIDEFESKFAGAIILSDVTSGNIRCRWDMDGFSAPLEPHEARALGEALIAAADDVAPYKVQP